MLIIGLIFCILEGLIYPLFGVLFSKVVSSLLRYRNGQAEDIEWLVYKYCLFMVGVAVLGIITNIVLLYTFS